MNQKNSNNLEDSFEKNVSKNALVTISCTLFQLITRFFIPPIILHYVPMGVYGLWAYCFVFIGYFSISMMGISNVYVRYSAIYLVNHDIPKVNKLLSTGVICGAIISLIFIGFMWILLPYSFPLLKIPENLYSTAFFLIWGSVVVFSFELTFNTYKYLLHGLQKVGLQGILQLISQLLETVLIIFFLYKGYGIFSLLYAYIVQILVSNTLCAIACYRFIPDLSINIKYFDVSVLGIFFRFGGIIQLRSMVGIVNRSLTRILSGMTLGSSATALYDLGEKFPNTITSIPLTGLLVSLPASSHLHAKGEHEKINSLYLYGSRYMSIISGLMMGYLLPFAWVLIIFWLGPDPKYKNVVIILACFAIPYHMMTMTGPASAVFRSINRPALELIFGISEIGTALIAVLIGFYFFGYQLMVINIGIGATMILTSVCYLYYANQFLKMPQKLFFSKVILPGFFPYFVASLFALACYPWYDTIVLDRWNAFYTLLLTSIPYGLFILPLYYIYVLEPGERKYINKAYLRFRSKNESLL